MKKALTIILAMALVMSLSVPVFAADSSQNTNLTFSYAVAGPEYTVTIPPSLNLVIGDNALPISCEITKPLGRYDEILVTFEATQQHELGTPGTGNAVYELALRFNENRMVFVPYHLFDADGGEMKTGTMGYPYGFEVDRLKDGSLLVAFNAKNFKPGELGDDNEVTRYINIEVVGTEVQALIDNGRFYPTETYTGFITFGIRYNYNAE